MHLTELLCSVEIIIVAPLSKCPFNEYAAYTEHGSTDPIFWTMNVSAGWNFMIKIKLHLNVKKEKKSKCKLTGYNLDISGHPSSRSDLPWRHESCVRRNEVGTKLRACNFRFFLKMGYVLHPKPDRTAVNFHNFPYVSKAMGGQFSPLKVHISTYDRI